MLELPYKEKELSMLIFLPNEIEDDTTGLEKVGHTYSTHAVNKCTDCLDRLKIDTVSTTAGEGTDL